MTNPYQDIQDKLVELLNNKKTELGVNKVYSIIPLFLDASLYPIITVAKQTQPSVDIITTGVQVRRKIIFDIWLQIIEIDKNIFEKIKADTDKLLQLEKLNNTIAWKIEELLETNRGLGGEVLESVITGVDFRPRQKTSLSQSITIGTVWALQVETKNLQRTLI